MKTSKQIEKLAQQYADNYNLDQAHASYIAFIDGYNQCQEDMDDEMLDELEKYTLKYEKDMADKKYTEEDLRKAINKTIDACNIAQKKSYGDLEIDADKITNSLNKQD